MGTLYNVTLQECHSERSEESHAETLRCTQGDNSRVPISCHLV